MKKNIALLLTTYIVLILSLFSYLGYPSKFSQFEDKINDMMFLSRGNTQGSKNIIIIDIDEKSLKALGQWPWSRNKIAKILKNLTNDGVGIIGLDVLFAEPDNSSPKKVLSKLGISTIGAEDYDMDLASTINKTPTIVGYVFSLTNDGVKPFGTPISNTIIIEKNRPKKPYIIKPYRAILNLPIIQKKAHFNGYFNTIPDDDGVVRSIPMLMRFDGTLYPSISLEMLRVAMGEKGIKITYSNNGVESITVGKLTIPTDIYGRMLINYAGGQKSYRYISAIDIYNNKIDKSLVQNKFALIGTSAVGLLDMRSTPFDSAFPGVEVHANAIDNMINQNFISTPSWALGANIFSIVVVALVVFGLLLIPYIFVSIFFLIILNLLLLYFHYYLMFSQGIVLNTLFPVATMDLLFFVGTVLNFYYENKQKKLIKSKFEKKVSPAIVEELIKNNTFDSKGEEKEITIFFSDIRDFTHISEQINSASKLIDLLNEYMTPMVEIITNSHGTVDKFIGDSIMAYWNAPLATPMHADVALESSIKQIQKLKKINAKLKIENRPIINIGIGLNSGRCIVGEMGSIGRSDYTCIGDPVNLASRVEGLCKTYGSKIILTNFTKNLLKGENYLIRELDTVRVKGKDRAITLFECFGINSKSWINFDENDSKKYKEALALYKKSNFEKSLQLFKELNNKEKQNLYMLYMQRCQHFIEFPPKEFDGIFTYETKK